MPTISVKDDTSALIPHLCAVVDQSGEALHIVCGFDDSVQTEYAFARFVDNEIRRADKGIYVPDYSLRHYCFPTDTSCRDIRRRVDEPGALPEFVGYHGGKLVCDLPLRIASYVYSNSAGLGPSDIRALSDSATSGPLKREAEQHMERLAAFRRQTGYVDRFVTVLETARGAVVFDDSGYGQIFLEKFLQHLADRFFDPACRDLKRVHETLITNPGPELLAQASVCSRMYSRLDLRLKPERIIYHPDLVLSGRKEGTSSFHRLGTDMADLHRLVADYRLHLSERNLYIQALLRVRDQGFAPGFIASSLLAQQFFSRELDACRQQGSPPEASSAASRKAVRELKERFGIETPEIRTKQTRNSNKVKGHKL